MSMYLHSVNLPLRCRMDCNKAFEYFVYSVVFLVSIFCFRLVIFSINEASLGAALFYAIYWGFLCTAPVAFFSNMKIKTIEVFVQKKTLFFFFLTALVAFFTTEEKTIRFLEKMI